MRRLSAILLCLFATAVFCSAQTTKVRGRVLENGSGEPIPFAAVFFAGTQVGVTTDVDGWYTITARDQSLRTLRAQMLSYEPGEVQIKPGAFNSVDFHLSLVDNVLSGATVKADNRKARRLLQNIDAHRDRNNPELRPGYSCDVYSRMEVDLSHPREQLRGRRLLREFSFIFDYVDTSDVSGVPYLPILINESVAKRYHTSDPEVDRERILASKMSGVDPQDNLVAQFTGSMHLKNNFYKGYINAFNVEMPSPINANGLLYYNYYIIDSLQVDSRKTYMVRYHPKPAISTPCFDGEMLVDAQDWALRSIKARMVRGQNVNWVRDMVIETSYQRMDDSTWFYSSERMYADFSLSMSDSSKMISFIGNRSLEFTNPVFDRPEAEDVSLQGATVVTVDPEGGDKDDAYWEAARPYALTQKEKNIYKMVDAIQDTKLYTDLYDVAYTLINGYWDFGKVGIGPYLKVISFNPLEGGRVRLGARTSKHFSRRDRLMGYLAYGFKDRALKGGGTWEHLFSKDPTRKLTLDTHYDVLQLGRGTNLFNEGNILASIMGAGKTQKLCPVLELSSLYEHEFSGNVNAQCQIRYRRFYGNDFVPMATPSGTLLPYVSSLQGRAQLRLSRDETVTRGLFIKTYTHTDHPVLTFDLSGGVASCAERRYAYFKPEASLDWKFRIPPLGMSKLHINAGTIVGRVPYPMLHLHEGNGTFLLDKSSFSCMNFFEFASDTWATLMWDHNFYGFFLGKIPLLKKLQLREAITLKATWGTLKHKNDGTRAALPLPDVPVFPAVLLPGAVVSCASCEAPLLFPQGMHSLGSVPYVEAGVAVTNILRLFRVDFIWRLTHRDDVRENPRNFVVNVGLELKF